MANINLSEDEEGKICIISAVLGFAVFFILVGLHVNDNLSGGLAALAGVGCFVYLRILANR